MRQEFLKLVQEGLQYDNLLRLIEICGKLFEESPPVFGVLALIFQALAEEYNGQAISSERYERIISLLRPPLLELLHSERNHSGDLLAKLTNLHKAFWAIQT